MEKVAESMIRHHTGLQIQQGMNRNENFKESRTYTEQLDTNMLQANHIIEGGDRAKTRA